MLIFHLLSGGIYFNNNASNISCSEFTGKYVSFPDLSVLDKPYSLNLYPKDLACNLNF